MSDRWDIKCREVYMDNSQKYQILLNGVVVGEIVDRLDAVEKLRNVFEQNDELRTIIDEIRGIVGYPGEKALKKHGLTDTLPNIVRYLHREWLEQMHRAARRCIEKDIEIDRLREQLEARKNEIQSL